MSQTIQKQGLGTGFFCTVKQHRPHGFQASVTQHFAFLQGTVMSDFILRARVQFRPTEPGAPAEDSVCCLMFGHEDDQNFYGLLLSEDPTNSPPQLFKVQSGQPALLSVGRNDQRPQNEIRIERNVIHGAIRVYYGTSTAPILTAHETTFRTGRIGVGFYGPPGEFELLGIKGIRA